MVSVEVWGGGSLTRPLHGGGGEIGVSRCGLRCPGCEAGALSGGGGGLGRLSGAA